MNTLRNLSWLWIAIFGIQIIAAQAPSSAQPTPDLERKVELMIRLKFEVPTACDLKLGSRTPSQFTGYDRLRVMLSHSGKSTDLEYLISKDDRSLARLEKL